jgi:taurine dioxygenase
MDQFGLEAIERIVRMPRETYETLTVRPLTPIIGAEVSGVDLSRPLSNSQQEEVRRAFLRHHVLVFRNQMLTDEDHKRFARSFGELRELTFASIDGGDPHVLKIEAGADSRFVAGEGWHADGTADLAPSLGSMLYMSETPEIGAGGDTLFASMHLAYEMLSPAMRGFLETLTAIHDGAIPWKGHAPPTELPKTEHPVVVRHPDNGRKSLFVNRGFTSHIVQLSETEGRPLLEMLFGLVEREPALSCRVRWTPNTMVFWDNRCTQHNAVWDYYPMSRRGKRITVLGTRPVGEDG